MIDIQLDDAFFQKIAGWEVVKHARALLATDKVLSSNYTPPVLKGVVAAGETTCRAGLVIKGVIVIDNLCTCRALSDDGKSARFRRTRPAPLLAARCEVSAGLR